MKINDNFLLTSGASNILNLSKDQIESATLDGNTPQHVYISLELKKSMIRHKGFDKILEYLKNVDKTKDLNILVLDQYPLVASYNRKTHSKIINIAPLNTKEVTRLSYLNLYASVLYTYVFEKLISNKLRIPDNMIQPISNFWFTLFVKVFGRAYGLTGTHSSKLPGLKFLITLYILVALFGRQQSKPTYTIAKQYSGYMYEDKIDILNRTDMNDIRGFIRSLSELEIMRGMNIIKFATTAHQRFDLQMLPMFEDLSRFLSLIMVSSVGGGQTISKSFISKYNRDAYIQMYQYMEKRLF